MAKIPVIHDKDLHIQDYPFCLCSKCRPHQMPHLEIPVLPILWGSDIFYSKDPPNPPTQIDVKRYNMVMVKITVRIDFKGYGIGYRLEGTRELMEVWKQ